MGRTSFFSISPLASGKVLIVGGDDINSNPLATAEIFDPATGTFAFTAGAMPQARRRASATLLNDGRVLVAGGQDQNNKFLDSALIYDPVSDSFTPLAAHLSVPRSEHRATLLGDGTVLITGGITTPVSGPAVPVASADLFNPSSNDFTPVGAMTVERASHISILLKDGRVLVAGGVSAGLHDTAAADLYDPVKRTFGTTGSMGSAREGAAGVRLNDGRVLITGGGGAPVGSGSGVTVLSSAEIYDPVTGKFTPTADDMPEPHFLHAIALLPSGKVLVAGGYAGSGPFFFLEIQAAAALFDPATNSFASAAPLNIARGNIDAAVLSDGRVFIPAGSSFQGEALNNAELYSAGNFAVSGGLHSERVDHAALTLPDGKILITGGISGTGEVLKTAELYDPATERLIPAAGAMTAAHHGHTITLLKSGKVLVAGGKTDVAEVYNPATGTFAATAGKMTAVRIHATATLLKDGTVLIAGGAADEISPAHQSAELYNPVTDSFSAVAAPMRSPRVFHVAALLPDGKVLLAGGSDTDDSSGGATNTAELYDPAAKTFSDSANNLSNPRYAAAAAVLSDGSVLIVDGDSHSGATASADLFNPATGKFAPTTGSPVAARVFHCAALMPDGTVLIAGGTGTTGRLSSTETYSPVSGTFADGPAMVYQRAQFTCSALGDGSVLLAGGVGTSGFALPSTELFVP